MSTTARLLSDNLPIEPTVFRGFGTGSQVNFTINGSLGLVNPANLIVSLDGAVQEPNVDYAVNNNTVTFTTAPDNGAKVVIVYRNAPYIANTVTPSDGSVTSAKIVAGSITPDKLSTGAPTWTTGGNLSASNAVYSNNLLLDGFGSDGFVRTTNLSNTNSRLFLGANNTNYLMLSSNGNFGIGTFSPQNILDVNGTINFGLRDSSGGFQTGYLSNIWSGSHGFRFFTLGSTYFNGTNWITNLNGSYSSNYVSVVGGDTEGIKFYTQNWTGNTQRTDSTETFNSYERMRIGINGVIDFKNNPVIGSTTFCKAWVNFNGYINKVWTIAAAGNKIQLNGGGSSLGTWQIPTGGAPVGSGENIDGVASTNWTTNNHLGLIFYINVGGNYQNLGSVTAIPNLGVPIRIITILSNLQAQFEFVDKTLINPYDGSIGTKPTSSLNSTVDGNGNTGGFSYLSNGIRNSYNVTDVTKIATGKHRVFFSTPFSTKNYAIAGGVKYQNDGGGSVMTVDINRDPNRGLFEGYCDISTGVYTTYYDCEITSIMFFGI